MNRPSAVRRLPTTGSPVRAKRTSPRAFGANRPSLPLRDRVAVRGQLSGIPKSFPLALRKRVGVSGPMNTRPLFDGASSLGLLS